jgi:exosortase A-associated hydrolase 1
MGWSERALTFDCCGDQLVGVLCEPTEPAALGIVLLVGGPQYRAGSHRQYTELARALAGCGFTVLRFDFRGMGDSEGQPRDFEDGLEDDIATAVGVLMASAPRLGQVALWGLCGGANAALMYLASRDDRRIAGVALANPWIRTETGQAKTQIRHYYAGMLRDPKAWRRMLTGGIRLRSILEFGGKLGRAIAPRAAQLGRGGGPALPYHEAMALGWVRCPGRPLLLLSENDLTAREFEQHVRADAQWQRAFARVPAERVTLRGADHTCSSPGAMSDLIRTCVDWARSLLPVGGDRACR